MPGIAMCRRKKATTEAQKKRGATLHHAPPLSQELIAAAKVILPINGCITDEGRAVLKRKL